MPPCISSIIMQCLTPTNAPKEKAIVTLCSAGLSENAIELIKVGALDFESYGEAMLSAACRAGLYSVAELLVEEGASITLRVVVSTAASGNVALFKAIDPGCTEFRKHL